MKTRRVLIGEKCKRIWEFRFTENEPPAKTEQTVVTLLESQQPVFNYTASRESCLPKTYFHESPEIHLPYSLHQLGCGPRM
jgi:hypothetical protein